MAGRSKWRIWSVASRWWRARHNADICEAEPGLNDPYPYGDSLLDTGAKLYDLARNSRAWVKRRIELVEFDDDRTARRTTTLDIDLSCDVLKRVPTWRGRLLLPIKMFTRGYDVDVTVANTSGKPLPQLTRRHERNLAAAAMLASCPDCPDDAGERRQAFRLLRSMLDPELYQDRRSDGVDGPPDDKSTTLRDRLGALLSRAAARVSSQSQLGRDPCPVDPLAPIRCLPWVAQAPDWWRGEVLEMTTKRFVIACVPSPESNDDGALVRLTVTHVDSLARASEPPAAQWEKALTWVLGKPRLDDHPLYFAAHQVGACESFHFELRAPEGIMVRKGALAILEAEAETAVGALRKAADDVTEPDLPLRTYEQDDPHPDRMHVYYAPGLYDRKVGPDWLIVGRIGAVLRPAAPGTMVAGLVASVIATVVLLFLWGILGWNELPDWVPDWFPQWRQVYGGNREAVVTVILLGPTLLATFVIGQNEHLMARRYFVTYRVRMLLQALACFVASLVIAVKVPQHHRWWVLAVVSLISLTCTWQSVSSFRRSRQAIADRTHPMDRRIAKRKATTDA